jgi:hypothetical protein
VSPADSATLSLLDPAQGNCPNGHSCGHDETMGYRFCATCGYRGLALVCWDATERQIRQSEASGADAAVVDWARSFLAERAPS